MNECHDTQTLQKLELEINYYCKEDGYLNLNGITYFSQIKLKSLFPCAIFQQPNRNI